MDRFIARIDAWLIALAFAVAMLAGWAIGWWRGKRARVELTEDPGIKFTDASMALLGLLLAFTFSMALNWHEQRRMAVVAESNAIADFYTCASLLKQPHCLDLQGVIRKYALYQLETPRGTREDDSKITQESQAMQAEMTNLVNRAVADGTPIALALTNTLNNLTSTHASRVAAYRARLPWSIVILLLLSAVCPSFLIGEKQGASRVMHLSGSCSFIALVSLVIYVILDLNQPSAGVITVSKESLEQVIQSMSN